MPCRRLARSRTLRNSSPPLSSRSRRSPWSSKRASGLGYVLLLLVVLVLLPLPEKKKKEKEKKTHTHAWQTSLAIGAFATTLTTLSLSLMEWRGVTTANAYIANFFFLAAFGLLVTAQWELAVGNGLSYSIFSAFGENCPLKEERKKETRQTRG